MNVDLSVDKYVVPPKIVGEANTCAATCPEYAPFYTKSTLSCSVSCPDSVGFQNYDEITLLAHKSCVSKCADG